MPKRSSHKRGNYTKPAFDWCIWETPALWTVSCKKAIARAERITEANDRFLLNIAFNYGGRNEILYAVRRILADGVSPDQVNDELFGRYLYTDGCPDPDLIIRTGGEQRLSNFLIWQAAYSEYYHTPVLWPDLGEEEIGPGISRVRAKAKTIRRAGRTGRGVGPC